MVLGSEEVTNSSRTTLTFGGAHSSKAQVIRLRQMGGGDFHSHEAMSSPLEGQWGVRLVGFQSTSREIGACAIGFSVP